MYNLVAIRFLEKDLIRLTAQVEAMEAKATPEPKLEPAQQNEKPKPKIKYVQKNQGIHLAV